MKHFVFVLLISLLGTVLLGQNTPVESSSLMLDDQEIELDLSLGAGVGINTQSENHWGGGVSSGIGVVYNYLLAPRVRVRGGVSGQLFSSTPKVDHPYPYIMDMDMNLLTFSSRLSVGGDWSFLPQMDNGNFIYVGASVYIDAVHHARAHNTLHYVNKDEDEFVTLTKDFHDPIPGFQTSLGTCGPLGHFEIRYWEDVRSFSISRYDISKQRRSFVGVSGSIKISNLSY